MGVDPRVLFAAERTLLAWIRTGLALMGFGFVLARFGLYLREVPPVQVTARSPHFSVSAGILLVAIGVLANAISMAQHIRIVRRLQAGETAFPARLSPAIILAATLGLLGVAGCLYLVAL
ncbi:DUF202 domain-containing protein [bacterium]|nr:MAG: DUF202 domain-containing protein [bacterium]